MVQLNLTIVECIEQDMKQALVDAFSKSLRNAPEHFVGTSCVYVNYALQRLAFLLLN